MDAQQLAEENRVLREGLRAAEKVAADAVVIIQELLAEIVRLKGEQL